MDKKHVLEIIENNLGKMTDLEKEIAQYFLTFQTIYLHSGLVNICIFPKLP